MTSMVPFENLPTSTATSMVYSNINLDLKAVFSGIPITHIVPPLTKKKKNIDRKALKAPYGAIISIQKSIFIRGIRMSKKKTYWCPSCQLLDDDDEEIHSVLEQVRPITKEDAEIEALPMDTKKIHFVCSECDREFQIKQLREIVPFLNQVTIVVSIGHVIVNVMMFRDNFKLAGNKSYDDAIEVIMILWENYISTIQDSWTFRTIKDTATGEMVTGKDVHFLFEIVMRNVDFKLGFAIDKKKLNKLMNKEEYKDRVKLCQCETTSATHVNVKMKTSKPDDFMYDVLVYKKGCSTDPYFTEMKEKIYAKNKAVKEKFITFIVFSSAEIILTGRYPSSMKDQYEFFVKTATERRSEIEERIDAPTMSIREYLESMK